MYFKCTWLTIFKSIWFRYSKLGEGLLGLKGFAWWLRSGIVGVRVC